MHIDSSDGTVDDLASAEWRAAMLNTTVETSDAPIDIRAVIVNMPRRYRRWCELFIAGQSITEINRALGVQNKVEKQQMIECLRHAFEAAQLTDYLPTRSNASMSNATNQTNHATINRPPSEESALATTLIVWRESDLETAKILGDGDVSVGVRCALRLARAYHEQDAAATLPSALDYEHETYEGNVGEAQ